MNQQPDKLFREKLAGFQKPVSATAWNRVEAKLQKKNNWKLWLNVAASLVVIAMATFLLWPESELNNQPTRLAEKQVNDDPVKDQAAPEKIISPAEKTVVEKEEPSQSISGKKPKAQKANVQKIQQTEAQLAVVTENKNQEEVPESVIKPEETALHENIQNENSMTEATPSKEEDNGVTIVYSAEEVNEKYLDKKSLAEATSDERKPSTLRKLLQKAYNLKNNQDPFGDLRQKKNEILALNFKSEKQRSQK
jgi:hypothetical protein